MKKPLDTSSVTRLFTVLVCIGAAGCSGSAGEDEGRETGEGSDTEARLTADAGARGTTRPVRVPVADAGAPRATDDAGDEDLRADAGVSEADAGLPIVWCWLVPDPRCGTPAVIAGC